MEIDGLNLRAWRALSRREQDELVPLDRPIVFHIGSATVLAEFTERAGGLVVNLAQIDGGGEGVLLRLWKLIVASARDRDRAFVQWNVFAATCADPNPRLLAFLRANAFDEVEDPEHGRIFTRRTALKPNA